MNPILMTVIFFLTLGAFAWSANRRMRLLLVTGTDTDFRFDFEPIVKRVENVLVYALGQKKMAQGKYQGAGLAHIAIFAAFQVLLLNTILLWGRAYDRDFDFFGLLGERFIVGQLYSLVKELVAAAAVVGSGVFVYYRVVVKEKRMTLSGEGLLILGIISTMMIADFLYVGGHQALEARFLGGEAHWHWWAPIGSALAVSFSGLSDEAILWIEAGGFWWHATWVLPRARHRPPPDVLWACTTCRACEEQCPVMITYVDKIVDMRRNLVMVREGVPGELQKPSGMETNGNPWNISPMDRGSWPTGLDVPLMSRQARRRGAVLGGLRGRATTTAPRRSPRTAQAPQQAGWTSPSWAARRPARATPRAAPATSTSS
jgi:NAD-dependent dihydropyrimidine dehydrogenase PreA subunit